MKIIIIIFYIITILGVIAGSIMFLITLASSTGAPQEVAGSAMSLCFVIIPYCLARAVEKILGGTNQKKVENELSGKV